MMILTLLLILIIQTTCYAGGQLTLTSPDGKALGTMDNPIYVSTSQTNFIGTQKYNGSGSGANLGAPDSNARTSYFKLEAESDFVRVRIGLLNTNTSIATGYIGVAAVTETADDSTSANRWYPTVGGTTYNVLQDNSNPYGWRRLTFNGATSGDIPAAGRSSGAAHDRPQVLWSDWLEMNSVPRADGGTRPLLMVRIYKDGSSNPGSVVIDAGGTAGHSKWVNAAGQDFYRIYASGRLIGSDGVTTLTNLPAESTMYGAGNYVPIIFQFEYKVPARTFICIGDSIQEAGGYQSYNYDNFSLRAILAKSTTRSPINVVNLGMSSNPSANYMQHALELLDSGVRPTDILIEGFSPNDLSGGSATTYTNSLRQALIYQVIKKAKRIGARVYVWTYGISVSGSADVDSANWTRDLASKGLVTLIDFDSAFGSSIIGVDNTHMSSTGLATAANYFKNRI